MQKMKYKLLTTLVIAAPLLLNTGVAATVHACSNNNSAWNSTSNNSRNPGYPSRVDTYPVHHYTPTIIYTSSNYSFVDFKTKLDTLVAAGTITQAQETTILNLYYNGQITANSDLKNKLDVLVTVGTITQSQEYSILSLFTNWGSSWKIPAPATPTVPVPVVTTGSGSTSSATSSTGSGTTSNTASSATSNTGSNTNFSLEDFKTKLDTLVTAGTITQDQETTILNLFNKGELTTKNLKSQIDILVIVGVITSNQAVLIQH
ncbi:hypothetical protein ACJDU8_18645 [Clostridium sp. WILCCON 0269]|uniref:DUF4476 domain-containing protein n=1 Tax=Candidatus Clostridium eludens TaxID=3381663 RepID=A0ABW8SQC5_9CLOT